MATAELSTPDAVNQRWSMDFVSDQLAIGRCYRVLNIVDDFSREYVLKVVDFSISGAEWRVNLIELLSNCQKRLPVIMTRSLPPRHCTSGRRKPA